ncbi:hypothetical protein NQZ79_g7040 [Umbelopsis isabellina]|nr:hypothetical protein NQZ79_g7040 [Umbelopsis isabellina]
MGNQASKAIEKTKDRKSRQPSRARSLASSSASSTGRPKINIASITEDANMIPKSTPTTSATAKHKKEFNSLVIDQDDYKEIDRSQRQHYVLKSSRKANHWAPFKGKGVILDIGTGHGDWAYEVASAYPNARVIGLDVNPPSTPVTIQRNLIFKVQDIKESWDIRDNSVDFLFQRDMNNVLLQSDWKHILQEIYRVVRPGGVIELLEQGKLGLHHIMQDFLLFSLFLCWTHPKEWIAHKIRFTTDLSHHNAGPTIHRANEYYKAECEQTGRDITLSAHLTDMLSNVGFVRIEQKNMDIPVGEWPSDTGLKQLGFNNLELQRSQLRFLRSVYIQKNDISTESYDAATKAILAEYEQFQGFTRWTCWVAYKPAADTFP